MKFEKPSANENSEADLERNSSKTNTKKRKKILLYAGIAVAVCIVCLVSVLTIGAARKPESYTEPENTAEKSGLDKFCSWEDTEPATGKENADLNNDATQNGTEAETVSNTDAHSPSTSRRENKTTASEKQTTEAATVPPDTGIICEDYPCYNSYEEYLEALKTMNLPSSFIRFDQISGLGYFRNCVLDFCPEHGEFGSYSYMINVNDAAGTDRVSLTVRIRNASDKITSENIISDAKINTADLRSLKTNDTGVYSINDTVFKYVRGKLDSISFVVNGFSVSIVQPGPGTWEKVKMSSDSLLCKLLNAETAVEGITQMKNSISK